MPEFYSASYNESITNNEESLARFFGHKYKNKRISAVHSN